MGPSDIIKPKETIQWKFWVELIAPDGNGVNQIGYTMPSEKEFNKVVKQFEAGKMRIYYVNKEGQMSLINIDNPYILHAYPERISSILELGIAAEGGKGNLSL
jgi:hypothetical protein